VTMKAASIVTDSDPKSIQKQRGSGDGQSEQPQQVRTSRHKRVIVE